MKRLLTSACISLLLVTGAAAQPHRATHSAPRISTPEARIVASGLRPGSTSIDISDDHWTARGYDLKSLLAEVYNLDPRRIELPQGVDTDARYDVTLNLTADSDADSVQQLLAQAIQRKFGVTIAPETREMDVYVMTAPNGPGSDLRSHGRATLTKLVTANADDEASDDAGQITYFGRNCSGQVSSQGIAASAGSIAEFRRTLEPDLDRVLLDETHLTGAYDFKLANYTGADQLFTLMQQRLGITVTPAHRQVTVLTVRPTQEMRAAL
jgi:uncharacterized protein (TIGR03435 family)